MFFDERRLLARLRCGDRNAYAEVAEKYHNEIWRYAYRLCGDSDTAADVCQETALRVWQSAPEFRDIVSLKAWIYKVAHNIYVDHLRKYGREIALPEVEICGREAFGGEILTQIDLERALDSLPDDLREALILTKIQELTCREAAEVLDLPEGTIKWRVAAGLKRLREIMDGE